MAKAIMMLPGNTDTPRNFSPCGDVGNSPAAFLSCRSNWLIIALLIFAIFPAFAQARAQEDTQPASSYSAEVAQGWSDLHLKLVGRTWGFSPPVAARAFGYLGVTLYEAVVPGMPDHQSLARQLSELGDLPQPEAGVRYHWPTAANSALASMTRSLFATANAGNKAAIEGLYEQYNARFLAEIDSATFERSSAYGEMVASAIFEWSMTDGGHEGYKRNFPLDYQPPTGAGLWQPTARAKGNPQPAMQPAWGNNRTFVPETGNECEVAPPLEYSEDPESEFYDEALEIYNIVNELTPEQLEIARFWADDPFRTATPAGHSISLLTQALEQQEATLDVAAEAYAKMGIALADAFINCWRDKYVYNLARPVTYIQQVIDPNWQPVLITPPFPEYPSGHSVESSAAAAILTSLFGDDFAFTDHTHDEWGLTARSFDSFESFAHEAGYSRMYGGIHYRAAVEHGWEQGKCVAERVNGLRFRR
jgi:PAP2 superfamily